jgi:hypothetical protein
MDHGLEKDFSVKEVTQMLMLTFPSMEENSFLLESTMEIHVLPMELNSLLLMHLLPTLIIDLLIMEDTPRMPTGLLMSIFSSKISILLPPIKD